MKEEIKTIQGVEFTSQEIKIISLLLDNKSYKEIGIEINISHRTVESHIYRIISKINGTSKNDIINFIKASKDDFFVPDDCSNFVNKMFSIKKILYALILLLILFVVTFVCFFKNGDRTTNIIIQHETKIDRSDYQSKIEETLSSQDGIKLAIIIGSGGSGKTTMARSFLRKSCADICWEINAETSHSIFLSFVELAEALSKTEKLKKELQIIKSITNNDEMRRLLINFVATSLSQHKNWILLFDNVNDFSVISQYFPQYNCGDGTLLITTRNKNLSHSSRIKQGTSINIDNLSNEESFSLFCEILYGKDYKNFSEDRKNKIREFLKKIPSMPLDISAAAYYLKNTNASFEDYVVITEESTENFEKIQSKLLEESINYSRTRYGIITSTFKEIIKRSKDFEELLFFVCLFDSQNIPKKSLKNAGISVVVDDFIYNLMRHSLIIYDDDKISIHRSTQNIGLNFLVNSLDAETKKTFIKKIVSQLTPYEKISSDYEDASVMIPHLKSLLNKIGNFFDSDAFIEQRKIELLTTLADIYQYKAYRFNDALKCLQEILKINNSCKCLDNIAVINLRIGEIYTAMSCNTEAMLYLEKSGDSLNNIDLSRKYRLIGIVHMRSDKFNKANEYFEKAILELSKEECIPTSEQESDIYADMAFNYFMDGINRNNANKAVEIMKKAIEKLHVVQKNPNSNASAAGRLVNHISGLSGIYNALGKYDLSLKTSQVAEDIVKKLPINSDLFRAKGVIARERGLSHLRLNKIETAYSYFMIAKSIFAEIYESSYLFKLKMHEVECLIRLNKLDEAMKICEETISTENRERNNYCDLFFNTCFYHAAFIKYKQGRIDLSKEYFEKFFESMEILCQNILSSEKYNDLKKENAFDKNHSDVKSYFENSLKVFEAIYWKNYEFTKYYVEENLKNM